MFRITSLTSTARDGNAIIIFVVSHWRASINNCWFYGCASRTWVRIGYWSSPLVT